jgi:hypothetical protein
VLRHQAEGDEVELKMAGDGGKPGLQSQRMQGFLQLLQACLQGGGATCLQHRDAYMRRQLPQNLHAVEQMSHDRQ